MLQRLSASVRPGRVVAANALLDLDEQTRIEFVKHVELEAQAQNTLRRPRLCTFAPLALTVSVSVAKLNAAIRKSMRRSAAIRAVITGHESQVVIMLRFSPTGELEDADFEIVTLASLSDVEREKLAKEAEVTASADVSAHKERAGKIGVNERCPCGSGKKYKKCCRP